MASEVKHSRGRTDSIAKNLPRALVQPKSSHTSDELLRDFLDPSFDPTAHVNAILPPLGKRQGNSQGGGSEAVPLAELAAQAQALATQLNTQTTRLSTTLTHITDDILRSGSRLAYEVELLRGEMLGLSESLYETLQNDIKQFVPGGLPREASATADEEEEEKAAAAAATAASEGAEDPEYIRQLRTLTLVRSRLDSVIKVFGDAMDFSFPPSELSVSSSFLSVSAPDPGSQQQSSEEKGQQVLKQLHDEISRLLHASEDPVEGIEQAAKRIEELKQLASVWKGTAEEKGRNRFIGGLAKMVEERHRDLLREMELQAGNKAGSAPAKKTGAARDNSGWTESRTLPGGFGLISQLQKLRNGL